MNSRNVQLIVGLGNPGSKYLRTRHNIGFMALEKLAKNNCVSFRNCSKINSLLSEIKIGSDLVRLIMPTTYMNESGRAIRAALDWFEIDTSQLLILADDMDLPLGRIRLRTKGSAGGHNGLKSTIQHIGTNNFTRIKMGIGSPGNIPEERRVLSVSHVLGTFSKEESEIVNQVIDKSLLGFELLQREGINKAENYLNSLKPEDFISIQ